MPKTIVNIITEDNPIPAYLFITATDEGYRVYDYFFSDWFATEY